MGVRIYNPNGNYFTLITLYRPPNSSSETDEKIMDYLNDISNNSEIIIVGDINLPVKVWGENYTATNGSFLYTQLLESELSQLVNEPTRGQNILDLLLTNIEGGISKVSMEAPISDHNSLSFNIVLATTCTRSQISKFCFKKADFEAMRQMLNDDLQVINTTSFTTLYDHVSKTICDAQMTHVPKTKSSKPENYSPWWNHKLRNQFNREKNAYKQHKRDPNNEYYKMKNIEQSRKTRRLVQKTKIDYEIQMAENSSNDPKKFFAYINTKKNNRSNIGPLKNRHGITTSNIEEMAEILNNHFASVFIPDDRNCSIEELLNDESVPTTPYLSEIEITENDVQTAINMLNPNKSPGPDMIYAKTLIECKTILTPHFVTLFNMSLDTSSVPLEWKISNITPIFKNGDKSDPNCYRGISLSSIISKLLENIVKSRILIFLIENNIIVNTQHGFQAGRSCTTNLLEFYDIILNWLNDGDAVDVAFVDFKKAFDLLSHFLLISILYKIGIRGKLLRWISAWLIGRMQRVVIGGYESKWVSVLSGVIQGSVLGPLLFLIFVNEIGCNIISSIISSFADDTKIAKRVNNPADSEMFQTDIYNLNKWSKEHGMQFNLDKTKIMHLGSKNNLYNYTLEGVNINQTNQEKDLGILIHDSMKMGPHVTSIVKKANKMLGLISRSLSYKSSKNIIPLYKSLVRPILEYGSPFWNPYLQKDIDSLERVQRRATKMIPWARNMEYGERLRALGLQSLEDRRCRSDIIQIYKLLNGFDKLDISRFIVKLDNSSTRSNGYKIAPKSGRRYRKDIFKNSFFCRITGAWNSLPEFVVQSNSISSFKKNYDKYVNGGGKVISFYGK